MEVLSIRFTHTRLQCTHNLEQSAVVIFGIGIDIVIGLGIGLGLGIGIGIGIGIG